MMTLESILGMMKRDSAPYWTLKVQSSNYGGSINLGGNTNVDNVTLESGCEKLEQVVTEFSQHNQSAVFDVVLMNSKTTNQNGKLGPFKFQWKAGSEQAPTGMQGLGGVPEAGLGALMSQFHHAMDINKSSTADQVDLATQKATLEMRKELLEERFKVKEEDLKRREEEVEELRKKFESRSELAKNGTEKALLSLLGRFVEPSPGVGLSGSAQIEQAQEEPLSPEEEFLEKIFINIQREVENGDVGMSELKNLLGYAMNLSKSKKQTNGTNNEISEERSAT